MSIVMTGFLTALALVAAIGVQSAFVLRQAIRRERVREVILICLSADVVMIGVGTASVGLIADQAAWLLTGMQWVGAGYLMVFGVLSLASARRIHHSDPPEARVEQGDVTGSADDAGPDAPDLDPALSASPGLAASGSATSTETLVSSHTAPLRVVLAAPQNTSKRLRKVLLAALAVSWLNPHAWVDTVVLLGTIAHTFGEQRWLFSMGAMLASMVWLTLLGVAGRLFSTILSSRRARWITDAVVGVVMLGLAGLLILG